MRCVKVAGKLFPAVRDRRPPLGVAVAVYACLVWVIFSGHLHHQSYALGSYHRVAPIVERKIVGVALK
jgi:hypothetical protein